jgi:hypothetical protein
MGISESSYRRIKAEAISILATAFKENRLYRKYSI